MAKLEKKDRKISYKFGKRTLNLFRPSQGYPTPEEISADVGGSLELTYAHGYMGNRPEARQNLYLTNDGNYLVYFIAAVVIVFDYKNNTQKFFTHHNDDITALCMDRREGSTLVASGQTDPIDRPGEGKDLPKVWVWDLKDLSRVELIDKICWGFINKICWSTKTGYIYVLCGDESQTLKVFNPELFKEDWKKIEKQKGKKLKRPSQMSKKEREKFEECNYVPMLEANTMKEKISGIVLNPEPCDGNVDEMLIFGKRKFCYMEVQKGDKEGKLKNKLKAVSIGTLTKKQEKGFGCGTFIGDGYYAVGAGSGAIFIGKSFEAVCLINGCHTKPVGVILKSGNQLFSGGFDEMLNSYDIPEDIGEFKGQKGKDVCLKKTNSKKISVDGSDMVFHPKAAAYDSESQTFFVGTKSNQIVQIEEKGDEPKVIIDGHDGAIWGLATHPEKDLFVTGAYDNVLKLWDANTLKCIETHEFEVDDQKNNKGNNGKEIVTTAWSNNGKCIVCGTEDSNLAVFGFDNENNKFLFTEMVKIPRKNDNAEEENISYVRFSSNSKYLGVAHMDSRLYIYQVKYGKSGKCKLDGPWKPMEHPAAPTHIQWSAKGDLVKTLTRDYEVVNWKLNFKKKMGKHLPNQPDPDDVEWADDPLPAGWDVQGLYQPGFDGTDLNDATVTQCGKLVVSGDDFGIVRLHNYPAVDPSKCIEYTGHAEFVVGVELLRSDKQLISCGGEDQAIFQWALKK